MSKEDDNVLSSNNTDTLKTNSGNFRSALDEFRENWQRELNEQKENDPNTLPINQGNFLQSGELDAEILFRKAVDLEQRGKVYDALPLYRRALQIEPDIEYKYYERQQLKDPVDANYNNQKNSIANTIDDTGGAINEEHIEDLSAKFREDLAEDDAYAGKMILSNRDGNVLTTELHISDLPPEILIYILRWVVSAQLDMRSLEQCGETCKGLYLCARDAEIWRLACAKVWGHNVGTLDNPIEEDNVTETHAQQTTRYYTWRQMFLQRERILFNGCYISKTTYLRMGENSFQDQYYRPVQLVEYYRYIRFMPDGQVLMMTNADEPAIGVFKLKNLQNLRPDVLRGYYRLFGSTVTLVLQKQQRSMANVISHQYARHRRASTATTNDESNNTKYLIEFRIMSTPKRKFIQLVWQHYSMQLTRNAIETTTQFDLTRSKYPPLWFSPVRSYHLDADTPIA